MEFKRLQRARSNMHWRNMLATCSVSLDQLVQPIFVVEDAFRDEEIPGLEGNKRLTKDSVLNQIEADLEVGVSNYILFAVPSRKGTSGFNHDFATKTIGSIKDRFSLDLNLWVDVCLCSSTESGHCCLYNSEEICDLEATLKEISQMALAYAEAGASAVCPSDMNDGRVREIRSALDKDGYNDVPIVSYSTKFASNFYGPFRYAANSAPQFGDRKTYQIDYRNANDALAASVRCAEEGADLLMVKPGMPSMDLIRPIFEATSKPVGAYQVSGEFASLCLLAKEGLMDFNKGYLESLYVLKRAGANFIITYGARKFKEVYV